LSARQDGASAWGGLAVLFLVNVLNFYDRQAVGAVFEPLRREFHLSDAQLGGLATSFTVLYAFAGLPLGRLADRWSRKWLLAIGVAVWAGLTAASGLATSFAMLLATRLGVGIGEAVCAPAATSWIGDLVPPERRARAMALFMMAIPVGGMLSFAVTGPVAQAHGWRVALATAALPAVLLIPALAWLREPGGERRSAGRAEPQPWTPLLKIRAFWWIVASGAIVNFGLYSFSAFVAAFLTRVHGFSLGEAGLASGIGSGAAGILGALAAGMIGDRAARPAPRLRLAAWAALAAVLPAFAAIRLETGFLVPLMLAYGLLQMYYGLVYAAIQDLVAPGLRGTAMAIYFMAMYLCGASFGPLLTGGLSDYLARRAAAAGALAETARAVGLQHAMYTIPVSALVLAAVLWQAARSADNREYL
jgi:predicted MFS family arabinose efflux permease